jgi:hypothetical protein
MISTMSVQGQPSGWTARKMMQLPSGWAARKMMQFAKDLSPWMPARLHLLRIGSDSTGRAAPRLLVAVELPSGIGAPKPNLHGQW